MAKAKTTSALVLVQDREICATEDLTALQAIAVREFSRIATSERDNALRAILLGLTLHRIKASLPHGEFMPWIKDRLTNQSTAEAVLWTPRTAQLNANLYMRLSLVALAETGATKPELLALPGDQTELSLDTGDGVVRRFMDKLAKFIGGSSLNELLREHGIKDAGKFGGARPRATADDGPISAAALAAEAREALSAWLAAGRTLLLTDNTCAHLERAQVRIVYAELTEIVKDFHRAIRGMLRRDQP